MKKSYLIILAVVLLAVIVGMWYYRANSGYQYQQPTPSSTGDKPSSAAPIAGPGEPCGGNGPNAPVCAPGYHCGPDPRARVPAGNGGGICFPN